MRTGVKSRPFPGPAFRGSREASAQLLEAGGLQGRPPERVGSGQRPGPSPPAARLRSLTPAHPSHSPIPAPGPRGARLHRKRTRSPGPQLGVRQGVSLRARPCASARTAAGWAVGGREEPGRRSPSPEPGSGALVRSVGIFRTRVSDRGSDAEPLGLGPGPGAGPPLAEIHHHHLPPPRPAPSQPPLPSPRRAT